jgi:pSer/pThr/pTyr-binding forkhead associated (FHA) protein
MRNRKYTDVIEVEKEPFGSPYVLALAVIGGPDPHATHRITKRETTVGRAPDADFVVNDSKVSGKHFLIRVNGSLFSLVDLGSTNGTMLNENQVSKKAPVRLKNFDEIKAGRTRLLFIANRFRTDTSPPPG